MKIEISKNQIKVLGPIILNHCRFLQALDNPSAKTENDVKELIALMVELMSATDTTQPSKKSPRG